MSPREARSHDANKKIMGYIREAQSLLKPSSLIRYLLLSLQESDSHWGFGVMSPRMTRSLEVTDFLT
jgi:hypothetical protein